MTNIFITGGTGLLGNNVIRQAIEAGHRVVALARQPDAASLHGLPIETVPGDLSDAEAIRRGVERCDAVVHSAAHIHIGWKRRGEAMEANRDGTQRVVDAAKAAGKPLVHVSTVNVLAIGEQEMPADEDTKGDGQVASTYVVSKRAAESVVRQAIDEGLAATIIYPGFMLGPWDWKPSSGKMIVELSKRFTPMAPAGGCSVCDARDVAAAILKIIETQTYHRRYVLAGRNMTYLELWRAMAAAVGKRGPLTILRRPGQIVVGRFSDAVLSRGEDESETNSAAIAMSSQFHYYDSSRARVELGYQTRPFEQSLGDCVAWLRQHGKI